MNKFVSGKASLLVLSAIFVVASFVFAKSATSVSANNSAQIDNFTLECGVTNKVFTGSSTYDDQGEDDDYKLTFTFDSNPSIVIWEDLSDPNNFDGNWSTTNQTFSYGDHTALAQLWRRQKPSEGWEDWAVTAVDTDPFSANACEREATSTPGPTATPEVTPDPDVCKNIDGIQTSLPEGSHIDASGKNCVWFGVPGVPESIGGTNVLGVSTTGQVLGASTMAGTGAVEDALFNSIFTLGSFLTSFGIMKNGKKKN